MFVTPAIPNQDNLLVLSEYFGVSVDSLIIHYKEGINCSLPLQVTERLIALSVADLSANKIELEHLPALEELCAVASNYLKMMKISEN